MQLDYTPFTYPARPEDVAAFREHILQSGDKTYEVFLDTNAHRHDEHTMLLLMGVMLLVTLVGVLPGIAGNPDAFRYAMMVIFVVVGTYFWLRSLRRRAHIYDPWENYLRLTKFAEINGLTLHGELADSEYPGMMAHPLYGTNYRYGVVRLQDAPRVEWGNTVTSSKIKPHAKGNNYGYIAIELNKRLPHMVLDSRRNNWPGYGSDVSNLPSGIHSGQELRLEGNFNEYFRLFVPKGYERDALYIFTPDFMELLMTEAGDFDVEIIDNYLFAYRVSPFTKYTPELIDTLMSIVSRVAEKTESRTNRYEDERVHSVARSAGVSVSSLGQRLRQTSTADKILIVGYVLVIVYFIATW